MLVSVCVLQIVETWSNTCQLLDLKARSWASDGGRLTLIIVVPGAVETLVIVVPGRVWTEVIVDGA